MANWRANEVQKRIKMDLTIRGISDWHEILPAEMDLSHGGFGKLDIDSALRTLTEVNNVSFEHTLIGTLVWGGCELVELEVESSNYPEWGKMVWIPDHPLYNEPPKDGFEKHFKMNFYRAMFQTEKAGVRHFCLYSTAINGRFHKTLVYHRVVLNPPKVQGQ